MDTDKDIANRLNRTQKETKELATKRYESIVSIEFGHKELTGQYWDFGNSLIRLTVEFGIAIKDLNFDATRVSKAMAIARTFPTRKECAKLGVEDAYAKRERQYKRKITKGKPQRPIIKTVGDLTDEEIKAMPIHEVCGMIKKEEEDDEETRQAFLAELNNDEDDEEEDEEEEILEAEFTHFVLAMAEKYGWQQTITKFNELVPHLPGEEV